MSEEKPKVETSLVEITRASAAEVAKEIYADTFKPPAQETGKFLGQFFRTVFGPLRLILKTFELSPERLEKRVADKLAKNPPPELKPVSTNISGPVLLNYTLLGDDEAEQNELRDLYASLLASATDGRTSSTVHPSFASMISQMNADEARILRSVARTTEDDWPIMRAIRQEADRSYTPMGTLSGVAQELRLEWRYKELCINNLCRLEILSTDWTVAGSRDRYDSLHVELRALPEFDPDTVSGFHGILELTALGRSFLKTCVR